MNAAPRYRRIVATAVGYLLAGTALNVIVAWRFALIGHMTTKNRHLPEPECHDLFARFWDDPSALEEMFCTTYAGPGNNELFAGATHQPSPALFSNGCFITIRDSGWPWRSMRAIEACEFDAMASKPGSFAMHEYVGAVPVPRIVRWIRSGPLLPLQPLWGGFSRNSLTLALALFGIARSLSALRRRARLGRGLCPQCRYDLRASSHEIETRCPECGLQFPTSRFNIPRFALRWWMAPWVFPTIVLTAFWFVGVVNWGWLGWMLGTKYPMLTPTGIVCVIIVFLWALLQSWSSLADRPAGTRLVFTLLIAAFLSLSAYTSSYAIMLRYFPPYPE